MASVLALLSSKAFAPHATKAAPGVVLPIDCYQTTERSFAEPLSHGGALYLVTHDEGTLWLVAVLEAPETSGLKLNDKRKPGWYAPVNTTPITDITKLRRRLKLGADLDEALEVPLVLTPAQDRGLRELLDDVDAPVVAAVTTPVAKLPELSADLPPLARAASYLAGSHVAPAIAAICEAWRSSRVPELADLVDRATRLLPEANQLMFERRTSWRDQAELAKEWSAVFHDAADRLLPMLLLHLSLVGDLEKRTQQLATLPEDPRIGARLIELMPTLPSRYPTAFWTPLFKLWNRDRDVRWCATLRELDDDLYGPAQREAGSRLQRKGLPAKLFDWAAHPDKPELAEGDRPHVAQIERELDRLEEPLRTERALVDEIAARRDDDGPYLVYADWLIERGRPLGEYIALACAKQRGTLTATQTRRLATLVEVPYLCGLFDDFPTRRVRDRERGIDREIGVSASTKPRGFAQLATAPLVRALDKITLVGTLDPGRDDALAGLIRAAPALQRIENLGRASAGRVATLTGWTAKGDHLVR